VRLELGDRISRRVHVDRLQGENGLDSQLAPSRSRNVAKRMPAPPSARLSECLLVRGRAANSDQIHPACLSGNAATPKSRSTAGSAQRESQLSIAARVTSTRMLAR
jgi:hypothetical protein